MLLREAQRHPGAFRELYERYAEGVHGFHLGRTRDPDAAHDLTAETFAQAWLSRARFRDEAAGSAGPWLFAIARHVLLASVRRQTLERSACERLGVFERLDSEPAQVDPADVWLEGLDEAFDDLPESQREAIRLRVVADLDYDGVADALGTTPRAARCSRLAPPGRAAQTIHESTGGFEMTEPVPHLARLGDALEQAAARDLHARRSRRFVVLAAAVSAIVVLTGASVAAVRLISGGDVAASLPAGSLWLAGTEPSCTVVTQDVEYHCVLAHAPANALSDWKGTVEPTVDANKRVNGGCRSLRSDGREWECYIGEEAVRQQIVSHDFLGEHAPSPGVG